LRLKRNSNPRLFER